MSVYHGISKYIMRGIQPLDPSLIPWSLSWPCATCMVRWRNTQIKKWGGLDNGRREKLFFQLNSGFLNGNETLDSIGCSWIRFMNGFSCISQLRRMCCQKKYKNGKDVHHPRLKLLLSPPWNVWSGSIRSLSSSCKKFQVSTPVLKLEVSARPKHQQSRLLSSKWRDFFHNSGVMKLITPRLYGIFKNNCFLIDAFLLFFVPFQTPAPLAGRSFPPRTTTRNKATNNERQTTKNNTSKE